MTIRTLFLPLLLPAMLIAGGASLPADGPLPAPKPGETAAPPEAPPSGPDGQQQAPVDPAAIPTPTEKPPEPSREGTAPAPAPAPGNGQPPSPADGKPPAAAGEETAPAKAAPPADPQPPAQAPKPDASTPPLPPAAALTIQPEEPEAYAACLRDLKAIGARFEETARIDDGKGCGIDKPIVVTDILPGITLAPKATMRCEAALELARWTRGAVLPAAATAIPQEGALKTVNQASSYVCRLRNNASTGKISEHARGNAIDIASFTFAGGKTIAIQPRDEDGTMTGAFQRAVTATGCLYFETVLDPGSDEAHENHLHFDVLQRRGGYRYCR